MIKTNKSIGRKLALQALYQNSFNKENKDSIFVINKQLDNKENDKAVKFGQEIYNGTCEQIEAIHNIISNHIEGRDIEEVTEVEKCLIKLATYELKFHISTPFKVIINEYTELAKDLGAKMVTNLSMLL